MDWMERDGWMHGGCVHSMLLEREREPNRTAFTQTAARQNKTKESEGTNERTGQGRAKPSKPSKPNLIVPLLARFRTIPTAMWRTGQTACRIV